MKFDVDNVTDIQWQTDAFENLVLPKQQKDMIRALVESHEASVNAQDRFDDFIAGKGRGLVINLFGPPGVGKTLSAEATSECEYLQVRIRSCLMTVCRCPTSFVCCRC